MCFLFRLLFTFEIKMKLRVQMMEHIIVLKNRIIIVIIDIYHHDSIVNSCAAQKLSAKVFIMPIDHHQLILVQLQLRLDRPNLDYGQDQFHEKMAHLVHRNIVLSPCRRNQIKHHPRFLCT